MKRSDEEFKKLQQYWYERLEQDGFIDIEKDEDRLLKYQYDLSKSIRDAHNTLTPNLTVNMTRDSYRDTRDLKINTKTEYFAAIRAMIGDEKTVFRNEIDRYILRRHSEGAMIKDICEELLIQNIKKDRKTIRIMIRRYEMKWNIRAYSNKQLNRKKK